MIEGAHADFAPHMELRNIFRDKITAKTAILANFQRELLKTTNILVVYMTNVTTFEIKNILGRVPLSVLPNLREALFL